MSVQALAWAQAQTAGTGTRKAILMALANCHNHHTRRCNPRIKTLAKDTEFSERTVMRALDDLEDDGLIQRIYTRWDGRQGVTRYLLAFDFLSDLGDGESLSQGDRVSPQEPEEDLEPSEVTEVTSAPARNSAQKTPLDLLWDALDEHVQRAPSAKSHRKAYAKLVREMFASGWTPEMVVRRAKAYRRHPMLKDATLSVAALAKWGEELDRGKRTPPEDGFVFMGGAPRTTEDIEALPAEENARRVRELASRLGALVGEGEARTTAHHGDDGAGQPSSANAPSLVPGVRAGEPDSLPSGSPVAHLEGE